jgi:hypothetical protein
MAQDCIAPRYFGRISAKFTFSRLASYSKIDIYHAASDVLFNLVPTVRCFCFYRVHDNLIYSDSVLLQCKILHFIAI